MKHIFLHIVKTAGTSLRWTIKENYQSNELYEKDQENFNWSELSEERKKEVKMIYGHLLFGVHNQITEPCKYITFLRDPVERIISYYYYVLALPNNPGYKDVYGLTLEEFMLKGDKSITTNQQTKIVCGSEEVESFDLACKHLEDHFQFVGFVEEYRKSVQRLGTELNWNSIVVHEYNRTPNKSNIPTKVRELIAAQNQTDIALYNWAYEKFGK